MEIHVAGRVMISHELVNQSIPQIRSKIIGVQRTRGMSPVELPVFNCPPMFTPWRRLRRGFWQRVARRNAEPGAHLGLDPLDLTPDAPACQV